MTTATIAKAVAVSRIANTTYVKKSISSPTKIRGYHYISEGYVAEQYETCVVITYRGGSSRSNGDNFYENRTTAFNAITEALTAKGYSVTSKEGYLVVRKVVA